LPSDLRAEEVAQGYPAIKSKNEVENQILGGKNSGLRPGWKSV